MLTRLGTGAVSGKLISRIVSWKHRSTVPGRTLAGAIVGSVIASTQVEQRFLVVTLGVLLHMAKEKKEIQYHEEDPTFTGTYRLLPLLTEKTLWDLPRHEGFEGHSKPTHHRRMLKRLWLGETFKSHDYHKGEQMQDTGIHMVSDQGNRIQPALIAVRSCKHHHFSPWGSPLLTR